MSNFRYERRKLENGLVLLFHRTQRVPMVSMATLLRCGKDQNPRGLPGLSALTARLLDEGTQTLDTRQIAEKVESVGGQLGTFSDREFSGVDVELQGRHLGLGVELMADLVRHPSFPEERVELERNRMLTHVRSMLDDPHLQGSLELNRVLFDGTPFAEPTMGTPESLSRMNRTQVRDFHHRCYGPNSTAVVAVGDVDGNEFFQMAEEAFGDWRNPDLQLASVEPPTPPVPTVRRLAVDKEQLHVFLGGPGIARSNPDFHACQVLDVVLGGGPGVTSRIPRRVRDEMGLAYTVYADLSASAGRFPGRFVAYAGTSPELEKAAVAAIREEVDRFLAEGATPEELETARQFLIGSWVFELQSNNSVLRFLLGAETYGLPENYLQTYPDHIRSVTPSEVLRVARQYLDPLHFVTVLVGPPVESP